VLRIRIPHHFDADADLGPDPACHLDADPCQDSAVYFDADADLDPDLTFHFYVDPDPDPSFLI
jgi:hypothetical protein